MTRLKDKTLELSYKNRMLKEGKVLLETVDVKKIQGVQQSITALHDALPKEAAIFTKALDTCRQDLGKYLQGGIKQMFKNMLEDPVAKASTLANTMHSGLSQLPDIAKLYLPQGASSEKEKSIWELVPVEKQKELLATFTKAFKTDIGKTSFLDLVKGNAIPYIPNLSAAVQELLQNTNPEGGFRMSQQVASQPEVAVVSTSEPDKAGAPAQTNPTQAGKPGTNVQGTDATDSTKATAGTTATAATAASGTAKQTAGQAKKLSDANTDEIADLADFLVNKSRKGSPGISVDPKIATQMLTALAKNGKLYN